MLVDVFVYPLQASKSQALLYSSVLPTETTMTLVSSATTQEEVATSSCM